MRPPGGMPRMAAKRALVAPPASDTRRPRSTTPVVGPLEIEGTSRTSMGPIPSQPISPSVLSWPWPAMARIDQGGGAVPARDEDAVTHPRTYATRQPPVPGSSGPGHLLASPCDSDRRDSNRPVLAPHVLMRS